MKGRQMRWVICGLFVLAFAPRALAQDFDVLRGSVPVASPSYSNWNGPYVGGQIGENWDGVNFTDVAAPDIATISTLDANFQGIPLGNFPRLSTFDTARPAYGGFAGYNYQFEDAVVGLEFNFDKSNQSANVVDSESHNYYLNDNSTLYAAHYTVTTSATDQINEYGELRARFGWAFGNFLPYAFGGFTFAQINASTSVNVNYCSAVSPLPAPTNCNNASASNPGGNWTLSNQSSGKWYPGYNFGLGIDYALTQNLFIRGEGEYIGFDAPYGIRLSALSAHVGAGVKF